MDNQHRFRLTEDNLNFLKTQAEESGEAISRTLNTVLNEARSSQQENNNGNKQQRL